MRVSDSKGNVIPTNGDLVVLGRDQQSTSLERWQRSYKRYAVLKDRSRHAAPGRREFLEMSLSPSKGLVIHPREQSEDTCVGASATLIGFIGLFSVTAGSLTGLRTIG